MERKDVRETVSKVTYSCNDKLMRITNLVAAAMILVASAFRFVYMKDDEEDSNVFFIILTIYLILFICLLVMAEFRITFVRRYFNFLDRKVGRGVFILFLGLLILDKTNALEIVLSIFIFLIAFINMIVGWG